MFGVHMANAVALAMERPKWVSLWPQFGQVCCKCFNGSDIYYVGFKGIPVSYCFWVE